MNFGAFLSACVARKGSRDVGVFAISPADRLGSMFYALVGRDWVRYSVEVDWATVGMAAHHYAGEKDLVVVALGSEGDFWEMSPAGPQQRKGRIPGELSGVTRVAQVHEEIWLCGMGRIVWARDAAGQWRDISAPPGRPNEGVIGFTALAGLPDGRAAAAGWRGEIWVRDGTGWHLEDGGSNANFNALSVDEAGNVVVVGDRGALVDGRTGQWQAHSTGPSFNLQGVCHFHGQVFVCSDLEIFLWEDGRLVPETRFESDDRPGTCLNLLPGGGLVYSQGERDVFRFDGSRWSRVV
jgi:hypothetical protein